MCQVPPSIQQYLNNLTTPARSDSLHSSTDTLVEPDMIRREDLSNIPLSLQLALEGRSDITSQSYPPVSTKRPNTIAPQPQYPNPSTYRHPCGLSHEGPCPIPINSRLDYDSVKDAIKELDIQIQAQACHETTVCGWTQLELSLG